MRTYLLLIPVAAALTAFSSRPQPEPGIPAGVQTLLTQYACATCHKLDGKLIGPSWKAIAAKKYSKKRLIDLVYKPEPNNWPGYPPMVAQPTVPKADLGKIADWLLTVK
jgi:cytochrome c